MMPARSLRFKIGLRFMDFDGLLAASEGVVRAIKNTVIAKPVSMAAIVTSSKIKVF